MKRRFAMRVLLIMFLPVLFFLRPAPVVQVASQRMPPSYGFLGGNFTPNEDAQISTYNDISFACHFTAAEELQSAIDEINPQNEVLVEFSRAWKDHSPSCGSIKGPWGDAELFISLVTPLLPRLEKNWGRLFAVLLFDEPDVPHGGPEAEELEEAVDFLHEYLPGVPIFINWYKSKNNLRVPNVDWHSTTKGASTSSLRKLGKPMFLWWFNNESRPSLKKVKKRWQGFADYFHSGQQPEIMGLGWCCDSITDGGPNNNSPEVNAFLAEKGLEIKAGIMQ